MRRHAVRLLEIFGTKLVAKELGVHPSTLRRWMRRKRLTSEQVDRIEQVWRDRARVAAADINDAAKSASSIAWLVTQGRIDPKNPIVQRTYRSLKRAKARVKAAAKGVRLKTRKIAELEPADASSMADQWGVDVRNVYTFYHYL